MKRTINSDQLTVEIKSAGAEVCSVKNREGLEYMWQAKEAWPRHAPVLFPVVGKLKGDGYTFEDSSYRMTQHGFARDMEFTSVERTENTCVFELHADANTRKVYPFNFVFRISYSLTGNILRCVYDVHNADKKTMFFSVGAHPGFRCPLLDTESYNDYYLEFEQRHFLQTALDGGLRTNDTKVLPLQDKKLFLSATLFDLDALVFENAQVSRLSLVSGKSGHRITVICDEWPFFGIWSKKGNEDFVCLEPWYGVADHVQSQGDITKKHGIIPLAPGNSFSCGFEMVFA